MININIDNIANGYNKKATIHGRFFIMYYSKLSY